MSASVLVGYTTRYGSTQEVAETIAQVLRETGLNVDVQAFKDVSATDKYHAFVLGAPIYMGAWLKDMQRFLVKNIASFKQRPVWIFALGPTNDNEKDFKECQGQFEKELAKYPGFTPRGAELFVGRFDPKKFRFPENLLLAFPGSPIRNMPTSDLRNWPAIRAWAGKIAEEL